MSKLLDTEKRWAQAFAASQDELASLARQAIADRRRGRRHTVADNLSAQYLEAAKDSAREGEAQAWVNGRKKK